jgi:glycosyltransferase involved in cell wall biosynthesis
MMAGLVSVVIPAYNMGRFLSEAVASALFQSYPNREVIVVDDGSTDDTPQRLADFVTSGSIRYHYQDNAGLSAARNAGIALAKGEFIALLDADDVWEPQRLALQLQVFACEQVGLVYSDYATFDSDGVIAVSKNRGLDRREVTFLDLYSHNNFIYPSTVLVRAAVFQECGGFDNGLRSVEDYEMWLRIARRYRIVGVHQPLVLIRHHGANMSSNVPRMTESELTVITRHGAGLPPYVVRRRRAKVYFLNADRLVHAGCRWRAFLVMMRAFITCPVLPVDLLVVLMKIVLGAGAIARLRRNVDDSGSLVSRIYWALYSKY